MSLWVHQEAGGVSRIFQYLYEHVINSQDEYAIKGVDATRATDNDMLSMMVTI